MAILRLFVLMYPHLISFFKLPEAQLVYRILYQL